MLANCSSLYVSGNRRARSESVVVTCTSDAGRARGSGRMVFVVPIQEGKSLMKPRQLGVLVAGCNRTGHVAARRTGGRNDGDKGSKAANVAPREPNAKVTITVGCQPPKSNPKERAGWDRGRQDLPGPAPEHHHRQQGRLPLHQPGHLPGEARGRDAGGRLLRLLHRRPEDHQGEAGRRHQPVRRQVKALADVRPDVKSVFNDGDKTYGVPRNNYNMGLVYNRKLFTQAGLNPDAPPKTWAEVQEAAKKISALGAGVRRLRRVQRGQHRWLALRRLPVRPRRPMVSDDGKSAAFNSPEGKAVLENLKQMRWNDNSMGTKQLLQWEDLMRMMGSGKLGMMIGAPDVVQSVNNDFQGKFDDYGVTAVPESEGKSSLSGGDGYMFNPKASPEQIKAGLLWLEFELHPGKGQFNYARAKAQGRPVGLPLPRPVRRRAPAGQAVIEMRKQNTNIAGGQFAGLRGGFPKGSPAKAEPAEGPGDLRDPRRRDVGRCSPAGRRRRSGCSPTPRRRSTASR